MKFSKRMVSILLTLCMVMSVVSIQVVSAVSTKTESVAANTSEESVSANSYGLPDNIQDGNILHCFNWKLNDIKAELKNIAEAGFTSVQTSVLQATNHNYESWYWLYQPRGFYAGNCLGSPDDIKSLCSEAHKYGIKVIVDVVANHLEGDHSNIVNELKGSDNWHHKGQVPKNMWENREWLIWGDIGMQDLATEKSYVQDIVYNYTQELKGYGVDGLRWDAAKHIGLPSEGDSFWKKMSTDGLYNYGETLDSPGGNNPSEVMKEYSDYISFTDNGYSWHVCGSFRDGKVPTDSGNWTKKAGVPASKCIYWAESHDTYSNDESWGTQHLNQNTMDRAYAIVGARADAQSLYFSRPSATRKNDIKACVKGSTHFTSPEVAAVNHLHNACVGQKDATASGDNCAVVSRETGAVVAKVNGSGQVTVPNAGGLTKPGTYKDEVSGGTWTVTSSTMTGSIGSSGIAVFYDDKSPKKPSNTISQEGGKFKSDTLNLTLGIENATSGTYQIDNGSVQTYTGTTNITIGSGVAFGAKITVKLTATGEGGTTSASYTFEKVDPSAVRVINFGDNEVFLWDTANWSSQNCYSWPTGGAGSIAWPGSQMTYVDTFGGSKLYKFKLPAGDTNVLFNNGSAKTDDLTVQSGLVVFDNSKNSWVDANSIDEDVAAQRGGTTTTSTTREISTQPQGKEYLYGDVNLDGAVNVTDVTAVQKASNYLTTLNDIQKKAADVNGSGTIDVTDATAIQKYSVRFISEFSVGTKFVYGSSVVTTTTEKVTETKPISDTVTITLVDGTPNKWLSDDQAVFVLEDTSTGKKYDMTGGNGTWTVTIPKSVTNIKFCRNNPGDGSTWNSWTTSVNGTTYTASGNEAGSW